MSTNHNLKQLLSTWKVDAEVPPRFQADVWTRIAAREKAPRALWDRFSGWCAIAFYRPQMATVVVMAGLMLGVGTAYVQAQASNAMVDRQMEVQYMQNINPLAHAGHSS